MTKEVELLEGTKCIYKIGRQIYPDERGFFRELLRQKELPFTWNLNTLMHHRLLSVKEMEVNAGSGNYLVYPISGNIEARVSDQNRTLRMNNENRTSLFIPQGNSLSLKNESDETADVLVFSDTAGNNPTFKIQRQQHGLTLVQSEMVDTRYGSCRVVYDIGNLNKELNTNFRPVQINHSQSREGVFRGFHAETWDKLVYPVTGNMIGALIWIGSKHGFGDKSYVSYSDFDRPAVFIPEGWANSICVPRYDISSVPVEYVYAVGAYWTPESTRAFRWEPDKLSLPLTDPIISSKDCVSPPLEELYQQDFE